MEEGGKARVVRCPKCKKLLPELPDVPVYRCGGCDATLQVKNQLYAKTDASPYQSDEEMVRFCENSESYSGKRSVVLNEMSDTERKSEGTEFGEKDIVLTHGMKNLISSSSSGTGTRNILNYYSGSRGTETESSAYGLGRYRRPPKAPIDKCVVTKNHDSHSDELIRTNVRENGETKAAFENASGFQKFQQMPDRWAVDRDGSLAFGRVRRAEVEGLQFFPYADEGSSNGHQISAYENGEQIKNHYPDGLHKFDNLENDPAELLRKLDELRDQLSRSCDVSDQTKERGPADRRIVPPNSFGNHDYWRMEGLPPTNKGSSQPHPPYYPIQRPSYFDNELPISLMGRHDVDFQKGYSLMYTQNEILKCNRPFEHQVPWRPPPQLCDQNPRRPSNNYPPGHCIATNRDPSISHPPHAFYQQHPCSCLHCSNKHWQVPRQIPPSVFSNRQLPSAAPNHIFYHLNNPGIYGPESYNQRGASAALHSHKPQPHVRGHADLELDKGGFRRTQPESSVLAKGNQRSCRPVANGAPFITCSNCFELLQLPWKLSLTQKNQCKLRCGACSDVVLFTFDGKRLIFPVSSKFKDLPLELDDDSSDLVNDGLEFKGYVAEGTTNPNSDGYDSSSYNIQSTNAERILSPPFSLPNDDPIGNVSMWNLGKLEKDEGFSSSIVTSEDEESPDSMIVQRDKSNSIEQPLDVGVSSPLEGSPHCDDFECSPTNRVVSKFGKGSRSSCSDREKIFLTNGTSRQNSAKEASSATEMDCSYNEYSNSGMSQDSAGAVKEEEQHKLSKGGESFFTTFVRKSLRDFGRFSQSLENDQPSVSVNGHPISDRLVKKAEKKAGRIQPGEYWYDYRAGFWGVMGHQCLGIIPPFIKEFNYPLPKNCSVGNTGVFVNARELHQRDLDLLARRGLPTTRDKSYIVEISGRVIDEASSEELDNLGRLAPTVEKVRHGFGMRVPRSIAQKNTLLAGH